MTSPSERPHDGSRAAAAVAVLRRRRVRSGAAPRRPATASPRRRRPRRRRPSRRRRRRRRHRAAPLGTVRLALDWTPNTNHTGFYVARRERLVRRGRRRPRDPARTARTTPEALIGGRPGRVRDQLPGRADVRRRGRRADRLGHGDPPAHGAGDRGPRRRPTSPARATSTARPTPGSATRTRSRRSRRSSRHDGGTGDVQDRDPRHRGVRGAVRQAGRLRDHVRRLGGHRGRGSAGSSCGRSSSATTASRTSTRSSSPATAAGWRRNPDARPRVRRRRPSAGSSSPPPTPTRRPRCWSPQNPGVFDGEPGRCRVASQRFLADGRLPASTRTARSGARRSSSGRATPASCSTRGCWPGRTASRSPRAPDYGVAVHERLPAVTIEPRPARPLGTAVVARRVLVVLAWEAYVRLAGLDPITLPPPSRVVGALWDFREAAVGHLVPTLVEALVGCAVSVVLAIATAVALDRWAPVRRAVEPLLVTQPDDPDRRDRAAVRASGSGSGCCPRS